MTTKRRRKPTATSWRKGQSGNPARRWKPGQSGNPAGTWREGQSGNALGRPPERAGTFRRHVCAALAVLAEHRPDWPPYEAVFFVAARTTWRRCPAGFVAVTDRRAQARYHALWWEMTGGLDGIEARLRATLAAGAAGVARDDPDDGDDGDAGDVFRVAEARRAALTRLLTVQAPGKNKQQATSDGSTARTRRLRPASGVLSACNDMRGR